MSIHLTEAEIEQQKEKIIAGNPLVKLVAPATIENNGVKKIFDTGFYLDFFTKEQSKKNIGFFIPSSGAASRMFDFLYTFLEFNKIDLIPDLVKKENIKKFNSSLRLLPFYSEIALFIEKNNNDKVNTDTEEYLLLFIKTLLKNKTFNFENKPKGLIPFHKYNESTKTPFEEYIQYALELFEKEFELHFTIDEKHIELFKEEEKKVRTTLSNIENNKINISYSAQHKKTDTIALTDSNELVKDENGNIVFRKGGHGALIDNLSNLNNDVVFIRNIDNIPRKEKRENLLKWQKIIGGYFMFHQQKIFSFLKKLETRDISKDDLETIVKYIEAEFNFQFDETDINSKTLFTFLNRPFRVCGMVKNTGAPGGGPFWVLDDNGNKSLQIVEKSQINTADAIQNKILSDSTHFNPVNIALSIKDYKGNMFDLTEFIDTNTYFSSLKEYQGKKIQILEHPGLWNGSMAFWNTIFVEVPIDTFAPVKTVLDLIDSNYA